VGEPASRNNGMTPATAAREAAPSVAAGPPRDLDILGHVRCDRNGMILASNARFLAWTGAADEASIAGRPLSDYIEGFDPWALLSDESGPSAACELAEADGESMTLCAEVRPGDARGTVDVWLVRDAESRMISRLTRLQAALTVTLGTVHDVNNILTVLSGNLFLVTEGVRDNPGLLEQARRARNAAERGGTLLRELLTFNKQPDREVTAIHPGNHVRALEPILERALGSGRHLEVQTDDNRGTVVVSAAQLESVLINLVINARDALDVGGKVRIRVRDVRVDANDAGKPGLAPGDYACLEVRDNGSGIPRRLLKQVMNPLFTTKRHGRGSGLGLTMVKAFAERHRGKLQLRSTEGRGTLVRLWLPLSGRDAEATANMTLPLSSLPSGSESILLVSDDSGVRSSLADILRNLGYTVTTAERLDRVSPPDGGNCRFDLVVCERSAERAEDDRRNLDAVTAPSGAGRLALLQAGADPAQAAPDADAYVFRPVSVFDFAKAVRRVLEDRES